MQSQAPVLYSMNSESVRLIEGEDRPHVLSSEPIRPVALRVPAGQRRRLGFGPPLIGYIAMAVEMYKVGLFERLEETGASTANFYRLQEARSRLSASRSYALGSFLPSPALSRTQRQLEHHGRRSRDCRFQHAARSGRAAQAATPSRRRVVVRPRLVPREHRRERQRQRRSSAG